MPLGEIPRNILAVDPALKFDGPATDSFDNQVSQVFVRHAHQEGSKPVCALRQFSGVFRPH